MPDSLFRLVYYSKNAIPGPAEALSREVDQILARSQQNNSRCSVTGALMFNSGCFAQVLEGPRREIEETFERIQRDPRHGEVSVLQFAAVEGRGFPDWSMTFVGRSTEGWNRFGHIGEASGFDPARLGGERIFEILRELVETEEASDRAA